MQSQLSSKEQLAGCVEHASEENKVLLEWMDNSCKEETKINCVNVKHILVDDEDITVGAVVAARIKLAEIQGSRLHGILPKQRPIWSAPKKAK